MLASAMDPTATRQIDWYNSKSGHSAFSTEPSSAEAGSMTFVKLVIAWLTGKLDSR